MFEARSWGDTLPCVADEGWGEGHGGSVCCREKSSLPVIGEIDIKLAYLLPEKPAEEHIPQLPFW